MKKIEAIIRNYMLAAVRNALRDSGVLHGTTVAKEGGCLAAAGRSARDGGATQRLKLETLELVRV